MALIRRAKTEDSRGIHDAHMRSIREVCFTVHTPEEISGWGNRPYDQGRRNNAILNQFVWVVEEEGQIEGYAEFHIRAHDGLTRGHIMGLYITPKVLNKGIGTELMRLIFEEAKSRNIGIITLESTLNAHDFYKRHGFQNVGELKTYTIGGSPVRAYPMERRFDMHPTSAVR